MSTYRKGESDEPATVHVQPRCGSHLSRRLGYSSYDSNPVRGLCCIHIIHAVACIHTSYRRGRSERRLLAPLRTDAQLSKCPVRRDHGSACIRRGYQSSHRIFRSKCSRKPTDDAADKRATWAWTDDGVCSARLGLIRTNGRRRRRLGSLHPVRSLVRLSPGCIRADYRFGSVLSHARSLRFRERSANGTVHRPAAMLRNTRHARTY